MNLCISANSRYPGRLRPSRTLSGELVAIGATVLCLLAGCAGPRTLDLDAGPADVTLHVGEHRDAGDGKRVGFQSVIDDSRCPIGVTCVWAGEAHVRVWVFDSGKDTAFAALLVSSDTTSAPGVAHGLSLRALSLDPHPRKDTPRRPEDYLLTLRVDRALR